MASGFCLHFTAAALNFLAFFRELKVIHVKMYTINLARKLLLCVLDETVVDKFNAVGLTN